MAKKNMGYAKNSYGSSKEDGMGSSFYSGLSKNSQGFPMEFTIREMPKLDAYDGTVDDSVGKMDSDFNDTVKRMKSKKPKNRF
jgi:hypothetical protein